MKKLSLLLAIMLGLIVVTGQTDADALDLPPEVPIELDLDNWTRLYYEDGTLFPNDLLPIPEGLESKAFVTFNDISETGGPGGPDFPPFWVGGMSGEFLHGWERNVEIFLVVPQADGSVNLYLDHATTDPADPRFWEFEVYQTQISYAEFTAGPGYMVEGPTQFDAIATNLANHASSVLFVRGRFAESLYFDPIEGPVIAAVAINIPNPGQVGGEWINQVTTPHSLGVNAFVDVDPTVGVGSTFTGAFYGFGPYGSEYDLAIQNVRLSSEMNSTPTNDGEPWIISDDGVRGGTFEEQQGGGVCRVTGGGWDDILAVTIPAPDMMATIESDKKNGPVYSFGGQVGAPSASSDPPWGEWQHNFGKGRGPNGEKFSFHGGTSSSPGGVRETQIISVRCDDTGWCFPAREAPFHSIYIEGCGTFTNAINVGFEAGKVHYFNLHIDDLGEGPGSLGGLNPGQAKKAGINPCPDHADLHPIDPDTGAPECSACDDWYEIHIYPGVDPGPGACEAAQALAGAADPIHSVADYINGGNLQIHPPTGADATK